MSLEERKESFLNELEALMEKYACFLEVDFSNQMYASHETIYLIMAQHLEKGFIGGGSFELGRIID